MVGVGTIDEALAALQNGGRSGSAASVDDRGAIMSGMTDSSGTPIVPARDARLTPEAIAERSFTPGQAGVRRVGGARLPPHGLDDLADAARPRARARRPRARARGAAAHSRRTPPSDQDLIAALGEETARVLGQAREAAIDLRNKAEEHARRVVREAQETARELRTSTQQAVEAKTREAEDAARARATEIVGEARAMRERVLDRPERASRRARASDR